MGSPLGPVLANIFMVHLETTLVPELRRYMPLWLRYVDDTFSFIEEEKVDEVLSVLNRFHTNIKFTHELESNKCISFLDVKVIKNDSGFLSREVFRKETDTNIYLHWKSFAPNIWKIGTLKGLFRRAFIVCSHEEYRKKEINHLKFVFTKINKYPMHIVEKTLKEVQEKIQASTTIQNNNQVPDTTNAEPSITPLIRLPNTGKQGHHIVQKFKKYLRATLPEKVKPRFIYKGTKLGSFFRIKDKIKWEHESDLIYHFGCQFHTNCTCNDVSQYIGETNVRIGTRSHEHLTKTSAIHDHLKKHNHEADYSNFKILARGYNRYRDRKIAEALYIKDMQPNLNRQVKSHQLQLFV